MRNLAELLLAKARERPDAEHVRYREGTSIVSLSRRETAAAAGAGAAYLAARGLRPGDRVGIVSEKSPAQVLAFFAVFSTGAVAVPAAEELPAAELRFIFTDARCALILASETYMEKARAAADGVPVVPLAELFRPAPAEYAVGPAAREDLACLIYTSGSTGRPKGVMLTHKNFLVNGVSSVELIGAGRSDVVLSVLPYWHSFALTVELFTLLLADGVVAIPKDKRDFARNLGEYDATIICVVPRIVDMLQKSIEERIGKSPAWKRRLFGLAMANAARTCGDDPGLRGGPLARIARALFLRTVLRPIREHVGSRLRFFVSGGAPLEKRYQVFFKHAGIPIYQGYGLTESTPVVSAANERCHRLGSSGKLASWLLPAGGGDYEFLAEDNRRGKGFKGELLLRGDCVMAGYWRREAETAAAIRDGWLHTGDMGWVDGDGFLYLSGRRSNLVCLVGGEKFHPEPIEERLKAGRVIADCIVFGEGCKNAYALIVPSPEAVDGLPPEEIVRRVREESAGLLADAPPHWTPKDFALVPPFSVEDGLLTSTMKIRRARVLAHHAGIIAELCVRNGDHAARGQPSPPVRGG